MLSPQRFIHICVTHSKCAEEYNDLFNAQLKCLDICNWYNAFSLQFLPLKMYLHTCKSFIMSQAMDLCLRFPLTDRHYLVNRCAMIALFLYNWTTFTDHSHQQSDKQQVFKCSKHHKVNYWLLYIFLPCLGKSEIFHCISTVVVDSNILAWQACLKQII